MSPRLLARSWPHLLLQVPSSSSPAKAVYDPKAFLPHAALLRQASAHCARSLAAASRRSLGRVSVPVWLIILSDQLPVDALVSRYLANKLIGREPIPKRKSISSNDHAINGGYPVLIQVSLGYPPLPGMYPRVTHPFATRSSAASCMDLVRLACVKHAASVRPEPGSNSPTKACRSPRRLPP